MRPWMPLTTLAFYATFVLGSNNNINVPAGQATLNVVAGQATTITWTDPSSGTVTIKLQQAPNITPESGYVLASGIEASSLTATFTIPATANSHQYTLEIVDDTNPSNYNFSPNFAVSGATGTQTALLAGITATSASGTATSTLITSAITGNSSVSGSSASASATSGSSALASSASVSSAAASSASSASASSASASSASQFSAAASTTTSVPTSNAAMSLSIPGGVVAALLGGAAFL